MLKIVFLNFSARGWPNQMKNSRLNLQLATIVSSGGSWHRLALKFCVPKVLLSSCWTISAERLLFAKPLSTNASCRPRRKSLRDASWSSKDRPVPVSQQSRHDFGHRSWQMTVCRRETSFLPQRQWVRAVTGATFLISWQRKAERRLFAKLVSLER